MKKFFIRNLATPEIIQDSRKYHMDSSREYSKEDNYDLTDLERERLNEDLRRVFWDKTIN